MGYPSRWVVVDLFQVAQVDGGHDGAHAVLLEAGEGGAFGVDVVASINVFLFVDTAICPDQKNRKFLGHLAEVLIGDHSHLVLLDALLELIVLDFEHGDLFFEVIKDI